MKTIFHFNCVVCGAHPKEELFEKFVWPKDNEILESFLNALAWILPNIEVASWRMPRIRGSIRELIQLLGSRQNTTPLHKFEGPRTLFAIRCPLCGMDAGTRPYDPYFSAWTAWHILNDVQIGNLLFESSKLLSRIKSKKDIVSCIERVIDTTGMQRCSCGRPTRSFVGINSKGGYLCRWCVDVQDASAPAEHDDSFRVFVNNLNLSQFLAVTNEEWHSIRSALLKDFDEGNRVPLHLDAALIGNPTGKWLEPWRKTFQKLGSWPEIWKGCCDDDEEMQEEPSIHLSYREAYSIYCELPREVVELFPWHGRPISPPIRSILEAHGLVEVGQSTDIEGFLKQMPIDKVREISNQLNAGKGRTKEIIIGKILSGATPYEITNIIPEIKNGWVKAARSPFDKLPQDWLGYQWLKAKFLKDFVQRKFYSYKDIQDGEPKRIEIHPDCSDYCKEKEKSFRWSQNLNLNDVPPWYPGCMCWLI
jgi:hypothetical protein